MSNKTELQANNVELQEILDSVNALPDAGSGGGSVETCTITINSPVNIEAASATIIVDGAIDTYALINWDYITTLTIENVVCGSGIGVKTLVPAPGYNCSNGMQFIKYGAGQLILKAPIIAGVHGSIELWSNA